MRTSAIPLVLLTTALTAGAVGVRGQTVQVVPGARPSGWIGVSIQTVVTNDRGTLRMTAVVTGVSEGGPAAEAGVSVGDVLVSINGESAPAAASRLALRPGDEVRLEVLREGNRRAYTLTAEARPRTTVVAPAPGPFRDSTADALFRAMDSLRVRLVRARPGGGMVEARIGVTRLPDDPAPEVRAPFEFFVFGGEEHDSLRQAMLELNRSIQETHARHAQLDRLARTRAANEALQEELTALVRVMDEQALQAADLRRAMSEAARVEAAERAWVARASPVAVRGEAPRPDSAAFVFRPLTPYVLGQNRAAGAEVVELNPALATYFQVERGVLVVDVPDGTPAHVAGLRPGDVITRAGSREVRTVEDLRVGLASGAGPVTLVLVRQGRRLEATLR